MAGEITPPTKRRIRTERIEVITDPEKEKLDLVADRIRLNKIRFLSELESRMGLIMLTCKATGISHTTIQAWSNDDSEFREKLIQSSEHTLDVVEQALLKNVLDGDVTAQIFYLKTKGRNRGFGNQLAITGVNGGPVQTEQVIKISDVRKEIPDDSLDTILVSALQNLKALQPVAIEKAQAPILDGHVTKVKAATQKPHGYSMLAGEIEEEITDV